jgi:hypothetical protein
MDVKPQSYIHKHPEKFLANDGLKKHIFQPPLDLLSVLGGSSQ